LGALAISFPGYIENMVVKFSNASTADGYNPYKVTREGFDWEVLDPSDPWSYIGYWGDHQIVYLYRLLELSYRYHPEVLKSFLQKKSLLMPMFRIE
jgi:methionyl-tRNA synthetase